ncbi:protein TolR [Erythrobacter arachoides]|uniref:Protein TolR n=1 Tax=Aurantiacibacter arachoides TaxID=1850444 RepID=A0A845A1E4_9SPHN|nr:biopolymer transporter ExbD [Aurantiacibacter arachoides]MXO93955.1 protein TolR [Aurantiacibacter arachoides]GGD45289.1 protein TolR [Aurantiacibacter arachoides]
MAMSMAGGGGGRRGRRGGARRAPMAEINVTPFVDVMLVLLIIFMVTAPLLASGVPVDLPESRANALDQEPDQVTVAIDREGFVYVDDARVEVGELPTVLESLAAQKAGERPLVNLRADRAIDWGRAMAVMGELNRAGFNSISLVTTGGANPDAMPVSDGSAAGPTVED